MDGRRRWRKRLGGLHRVFYDQVCSVLDTAKKEALRDPKEELEDEPAETDALLPPPSRRAADEPTSANPLVDGPVPSPRAPPSRRPGEGGEEKVVELQATRNQAGPAAMTKKGEAPVNEGEPDQKKKLKEMRAEREAMAKTRAAPAPRPTQRASVVRAQMDAANAILLGALDAYAVDKCARDPAAAELVQSRLVDAGGDGAASPGGRVVSREVSVHAEIDPSLDAGVRAARAGAAEKAERDAAAALAERTTAEREAAAAQATLARKFAEAERREAEDRAKAAAVVEKLRGNLAKSKVTTHEERVHGLAEAGEENAVAQRIAAKMLAIKRAKGKDRARAAPAAPAALPDPFPESEGWL